jgi:endoplasmic reticulum-Golgi intermediate compartment protein 3
MRQLQRLDVFPKFDRKFEQDARQRTVAGGCVSVAALVLITWLLVGEVRYFASTEEHHEMFIDAELGGDMEVRVNVTFPHVPCDLLTLDAMDAFGVFASGVEESTVKTRIDAATGQPISAARQLVDEKKVMTKAIDADGAEKEDCPSCYGAERDPGECCHTCEEVRQAYARKGWSFNVDDISIEQCAEDRVRLAVAAAGSEGCNVHAKFAASRATGSLQFIPGRVYSSLGRRMHDFMGSTTSHLDLSHTVHTLEFGRSFPGQRNPLDGVAQGTAAGGTTQDAMNGRFSYFVKLVPTTYQRQSLFTGLQDVVESNQYSVTHHFTPSAPAALPGSTAATAQAAPQDIIPGVFMTYDLSPIRIVVQKEHPYPSIVHFLLQLCAVCGGVLTVAGLVDSLCFHGVRRLRKLREGKQL